MDGFDFGAVVTALGGIAIITYGVQLGLGIVKEIRSGAKGSDRMRGLRIRLLGVSSLLYTVGGSILFLVGWREMMDRF